MNPHFYLSKNFEQILEKSQKNKEIKLSLLLPVFSFSKDFDFSTVSSFGSDLLDVSLQSTYDMLRLNNITFFTDIIQMKDNLFSSIFYDENIFLYFVKYINCIA